MSRRAYDKLVRDLIPEIVQRQGHTCAVETLHDDQARVRRDVEVNFFGTLRVTRAFLPHLEASGGAVVNVLTLVALASLATMGGYSASKGRRRIHDPGAADTAGPARRERP